MDTPGGNPEYFYDKDSLFGKEDENSEMSKEDIINELIGIYSYSQDGATDLVNTALESLITNLGGLKNKIMGHKVFIRHTYIYKCSDKKCKEEWKVNEANDLEVLHCPHCGKKIR